MWPTEEPSLTVNVQLNMAADAFIIDIYLVCTVKTLLAIKRHICNTEENKTISTPS